MASLTIGDFKSQLNLAFQVKQNKLSKNGETAEQWYPIKYVLEEWNQEGVNAQSLHFLEAIRDRDGTIPWPDIIEVDDNKEKIAVIDKLYTKLSAGGDGGGGGYGGGGDSRKRPRKDDQPQEAEVLREPLSKQPKQQTGRAARNFIDKSKLFDIRKITPPSIFDQVNQLREQASKEPILPQNPRDFLRSRCVLNRRNCEAIQRIFSGVSKKENNKRSYPIICCAGVAGTGKTTFLKFLHESYSKASGPKQPIIASYVTFNEDSHPGSDPFILDGDYQSSVAWRILSGAFTTQSTPDIFQHVLSKADQEGTETWRLTLRSALDVLTAPYTMVFLLVDELASLQDFGAHALDAVLTLLGNEMQRLNVAGKLTVLIVAPIRPATAQHWSATKTFRPIMYYPLSPLTSDHRTELCQYFCKHYPAAKANPKFASWVAAFGSHPQHLSQLFYQFARSGGQNDTWLSEMPTSGNKDHDAIVKELSVGTMCETLTGSLADSHPLVQNGFVNQFQPQQCVITPSVFQTWITHHPDEPLAVALSDLGSATKDLVNSHHTSYERYTRAVVRIKRLIYNGQAVPLNMLFAGAKGNEELQQLAVEAVPCQQETVDCIRTAEKAYQSKGSGVTIQEALQQPNKQFISGNTGQVTVDTVETFATPGGETVVLLIQNKWTRNPTKDILSRWTDMLSMCQTKGVYCVYFTLLQDIPTDLECILDYGLIITAGGLTKFATNLDPPIPLLK